MMVNGVRSSCDAREEKLRLCRIPRRILPTILSIRAARSSMIVADATSSRLSFISARDLIGSVSIRITKRLIDKNEAVVEVGNTDHFRGACDGIGQKVKLLFGLDEIRHVSEIHHDCLDGRLRKKILSPAVDPRPCS